VISFTHFWTPVFSPDFLILTSKYFQSVLKSEWKKKCFYFSLNITFNYILITRKWTHCFFFLFLSLNTHTHIHTHMHNFRNSNTCRKNSMC
jgi:hypothetical protein